MNISPVYQNEASWVVQGTFDLSAGAAVLAISNPDGSTKTVRGDNMSVVKNGTGTYDVTLKGTSNLKLVELLDGRAALIGATVATALSARIQSALQPGGSSGDDIIIKVITAQTTGAAADTTGAITVSFSVTIRIRRMGGVL